MALPVLSLYRRHRPRSFDQVVGQEHIVRTLRNAIELDKVHHAYLFVGSRGTGKTSMAKLLACALNVGDGPKADFGPADPNCVAIMHGPSLEQIASVLHRVAKAEEIQIPEPALAMIARGATGSFRDALGHLEQLVTYGGKDVKLEDVLEVLGVADAELILDAAEAIAERDA